MADNTYNKKFIRFILQTCHNLLQSQGLQESDRCVSEVHRFFSFFDVLGTNEEVRIPKY